MYKEFNLFSFCKPKILFGSSATFLFRNDLIYLYLFKELAFAAQQLGFALRVRRQEGRGLDRGTGVARQRHNDAVVGEGLQRIALSHVGALAVHFVRVEVARRPLREEVGGLGFEGWR